MVHSTELVIHVYEMLSAHSARSVHLNSGAIAHDPLFVEHHLFEDCADVLFAVLMVYLIPVTLQSLVQLRTLTENSHSRVLEFTSQCLQLFTMSWRDGH